MTEKEIDLPYMAIIPFHIQADDTLPDSVKIYFGQITALAVKYGYCFATDEQLAKMKNTSIENIKRWNRLLENAGYIKRVTKNVPTQTTESSFRFVKKRKIYVNDAFAREKPIPKMPETDSNNSYEGVKNDTSLEGVKNDTYNNKPLIENLERKPATRS